MTHQKRGLSGNQAAATGGVGVTGGRGVGKGRDNTKYAKFWVSHRQGPFLIHLVAGDCEVGAKDSAGYGDDYDNLIEQGFAPCPKCSPGGAA